MNDTGIPKLGQTFTFKENSWKVVREVHDGPFSKVLMLQDGKDGRKIYAMKIEPKRGIIRPLLKLDVCLLSQLRGRPGFPEMITAGRTENFKFLVMKFVGPDLEKLQKLMPRNRFTASTAYRLAFHTLDSVQELHNKGWLHRDLKAQNFAVGLGNDASTVYMLDFGMARRFKNQDGQIREPRKKGPYCGTYQYGPLAAQYCRDQGPKDDLEGWFYMNMHMMRGHLPWHPGHEWYDHGIVREWKEHMKKAFKPNFFGNLPNEWENIYDMIINMRYEEVPAYNSIRKLMNNAVMKLKIPMNEPFDWQVIPPLVTEMHRAERALFNVTETAVAPSSVITALQNESGIANMAEDVETMKMNTAVEVEEIESISMNVSSVYAYPDDRSARPTPSLLPVESKYFMEDLDQTSMIPAGI